jgi:predicted nucleic acid-binding protein
MKDKFFIDTNVLVYANDRSESAKSAKAKKILIDGIEDETLVVSTQVLSEFFATVTRKIKVPLPKITAQKEIMLLRTIETIVIDFNLVVHAIEISITSNLSYWDSLIVAAAAKAKCSFLYSEDLNPGQIIEGVTVVNPFR